MWNTPPLSSSSINGYMSSNHYSKLDNLYTKSELDELIENSSSSGGYDPGVITKEQSANIANGSFDGLPIGFYWTVSDTRYVIMAHDQFYGYNGIDTHHVVVMPDRVYSREVFHNTNINLGSSNGGYSSSTLNIQNTRLVYNYYLMNIFGMSHLLLHTHDLTSTRINQYNVNLYAAPNTIAWVINSYNIDGTKYQYENNYNWQDADKVQFPAFKNDSSLRTAKTTSGSGTDSWWLESYSTATNGKDYCYVDTSGAVGITIHTSHGLRPAFLIY